MPPLKRWHIALIVVAVVIVILTAVLVPVLLLQSTYTCTRPGVCTKTSPSAGGAFSSKKKCRDTCNNYRVEMLPGGYFDDFPTGMGRGALLVNLGQVDLPQILYQPGASNDKEIQQRVASVEMDVSLDAYLATRTGAPPSPAAFMWVTFVVVNNAFLSELTARVQADLTKLSASVFVGADSNAGLALNDIMTAPGTAPVAGYTWDAKTFGKSPAGYVYDAVNISAVAKLYPWARDDGAGASSPPPFVSVVVAPARPAEKTAIGPVTLQLPVDDKKYTLLMLVATPADPAAAMSFNKVVSTGLVRFK